MVHSKWIHQFTKTKASMGGNQGLDGDIATVQNTLMSMQDNYIKTRYEKSCRKLYDNKPKSSFLERLVDPKDPKFRINRHCREKTPEKG